MEIGGRSGRSGLAASAAVLAGLLGASLAGTGCAHHHYPHRAEVAPARSSARGHGPPVHAPAHGYRRKHPRDSVQLVYDARLEVYAVVGREAVYWDGVRYVRWAHGEWRVSARIDGAWIGVGNDKVPPRLVAKYDHKHKKQTGKKRHRGYPPPAKHDY